MSKEFKTISSKSGISDILQESNNQISKIRLNLLNLIEKMVKDKTHEFCEDIGLVVSIEEAGSKVIVGATKDVVITDEGHEFDLGEISTDDLYSVANMIHHELFVMDEK
jgi:hypothetical protein